MYMYLHTEMCIKIVRLHLILTCKLCWTSPDIKIKPFFLLLRNTLKVLFRLAASVITTGFPVLWKVDEIMTLCQNTIGRLKYFSSHKYSAHRKSDSTLGPRINTRVQEFSSTAALSKYWICEGGGGLIGKGKLKSIEILSRVARVQYYGKYIHEKKIKKVI